MKIECQLLRLRLKRIQCQNTRLTNRVISIESMNLSQNISSRSKAMRMRIKSSLRKFKNFRINFVKWKRSTRRCSKNETNIKKKTKHYLKPQKLTNNSKVSNRKRNSIQDQQSLQTCSLTMNSFLNEFMSKIQSSKNFDSK